MLARVKLHLGKRLAGDLTGGPAPDGLDIRNASPAGRRNGRRGRAHGSGPTPARPTGHAFAADRPGQRACGDPRQPQGLDQRTANLNREIADLRTQVVSATDEIRLLHDRIPPAAPSNLSPGTSVVTAPTGLSDTPPPAQQRSKIRESGQTVLSEEIVARLDGSVFHSGSAELQPEAASKLAAAAQFMLSHPKVLVRIVGHTDASGNDERNLVLSTRRAETVRDYLADKFGLRVAAWWRRARGSSSQSRRTTPRPAGRRTGGSRSRCDPDLSCAPAMVRHLPAGSVLEDGMLDLGPTATAALALVKGRHGRNIRHKLLGSMQRAFHGHPAHYEAVDGRCVSRATRPCAPLLDRERLGRPAR